MKLQKLFHSVCIGLFMFCISPGLNAAIITVTQTDDDATLTLSMEDILMVGVNQNWGEVNVLVEDVFVGFTAGDTVEISVLEDDFISDDLLWQTSFMVTSSEVANGRVDRAFELIFTPSSELDGFAEIYAEALVTKDACNIFCLNDRPVTSSLTAELVEPVPVPAAVWLFGSGLIGLIGVARLKKA